MFWKDPLYRAACVCQSLVRMRFVRESLASSRLLLFGAKVRIFCFFFCFLIYKTTQNRYRNICQLVTFEQNHLACISQFLSGFLVPVKTYLKRQGEDPAVLKSDQVTGFSDALYAAYLRHTGMLEKLDSQLQTYPFCVDTGAVLDAEQGLGQIYLLLLDFIPILVDWSYSVLDGVRSVFFEKVEADQGLRLDHGSCRLLLWGVMRYFQQVRVPTIQILSSTPAEVANEAPLLCAAVTRMSCLDGIIRFSIEVSSGRLRLFHLFQRYVPSNISTLEKKFFTEAGVIVFDEPGQLKSKGRNAIPVRVVATGVLLFVLSDSGNVKKDKVLEVLPNRSISEVLLQADAKEVVIHTSAPEYGGSNEKKKLSSSNSSVSLLQQSRALCFSFDFAKRAGTFQSDMDRLSHIARNGVVRKKLETQIEEMKRDHPGSPGLPEFPVLLIQFLSSSSDESLSKMFSLTSNELKVAAIADTFDAGLPGRRAAAMAPLFASAGLHNVLAALSEYFLHLPQTLLDPELRKGLLAATNHIEMRRLLSAPTAKQAYDLMSYLFWFLGERLVPALNHSDFDDPSLIVSSVASCMVFWDAPNPRRMIMDSARAMAACSLMLTYYMEIFAKIDVPMMVVVDESTVALEKAKQSAKKKYEADELERTRVLAEREQRGLEKVKEQVLADGMSKNSKLELEHMVSMQKKEFELKKMEQQKEKMDNESAFEALKRQQAEAKARADAKVRLMKEKSFGGAVSLTKSASDASLISVLGDLDVTQPGAKSSSSSRTSSGRMSRAASNAVIGTSGNTSTTPLVTVTYPMIRIPELILTAEQARMVIVIPKLQVK
jgi:hypothetical protein